MVKGAIPKTELETTRATAQFPGLSVEIAHWRTPGGDSEQISIMLQAVPSFEAFGRFFEAANPLALWAHAMQFAFIPWLGVARLMALPATIAATAAKPGPKPGSEDKRLA